MVVTDETGKDVYVLEKIREHGNGQSASLTLEKLHLQNGSAQHDMARCFLRFKTTTSLSSVDDESLFRVVDIKDANLLPQPAYCLKAKSPGAYQLGEYVILHTDKIFPHLQSLNQ